MDLISVIVPVYNSEKYLKKCLRSICAQSYPHLEILLVDDGSTDQSGGICDDFAGRDRRVRVIHQQNGGEIKARHTGIAHAKGKYLAFVDADDWIDPDFIAYLYGLLQKHHTEIASCALIREYPKKSVVSFGKEGETVYPAAQAVGLLHGTSRHGGGGDKLLPVGQVVFEGPVPGRPVSKCFHRRRLLPDGAAGEPRQPDRERRESAVSLPPA